MLYRFISGDFPLTIMFLVVLGAFARSHWSGVREYWNLEKPFWRVVGRATLILTVALPLWIAAFDNWRDLLGYSLGSHDRSKSNVFDTTPTPEAIRWITLALIAISLVCCALIYARRQHGLAMLILTFIFGAAYFYFMNGVRMRADVFLMGTSDSLAHPSVFDFTAILFWSIGMYMVVCSVIAAAYAFLFSALAIPLHIVFSIVNRDKSGVDPSTLRSYRLLSMQAGSVAQPAGKVDESRDTPAANGEQAVR